jgi:hypothetical protein
VSGLCNFLPGIPIRDTHLGVSTSGTGLEEAIELVGLDFKQSCLHYFSYLLLKNGLHSGAKKNIFRKKHPPVINNKTCKTNT